MDYTKTELKSILEAKDESAQSFFTSLPHHVLGQILDLQLDLRSTVGTEAIDQALSQSILTGGKRLRPLLMFLVADALGLSLESCLPFARAVECVHAASLLHDDVIDQASMRRHRPTMAAAEGNKKAILAGDYLLADVIIGLAKEGDLDLLKAMSLVIKHLSAGEWLQWESILNRQYSEEILRDIACQKTASVMGWCTYVPAKRVGLSERECQKWQTFGENLGIGFQWIDDVLDFRGVFDETTPQDWDKDTLLDLRQGQVTMVTYFWLKNRPDLYQRYTEGTSLEELWSERKIEDLEEALLKTYKKARSALQDCLSFLETQESEKFSHLKSLIEFIYTRHS
jgi:geranylgeranyl pyrophosphate synthase